MELRVHPALHDAELRVFSPRVKPLLSLASVLLWGERLHCYKNSSKQQQSHVQHLGCDRRRRSACPLAELSLFPSRPLTC